MRVLAYVAALHRTFQVGDDLGLVRNVVDGLRAADERQATGAEEGRGRQTRLIGPGKAHAARPGNDPCPDRGRDPRPWLPPRPKKPGYNMKNRDYFSGQS